MTNPALSAAQIEKIVSASNPRTTHTTLARGASRTAIASGTARRDVDAMVKSLATKLGLDAPHLDKLRSERSAELRQLAEDDKKRAVDRSTAAAGAKRSRALSSAQLDALTASTGGLTNLNSFVFPKVDFIRSWPTPTNLQASHEEPGFNWAKYRLKGHDDHDFAYHGEEWVSFYTTWRSPRSTPTFPNFAAFLEMYGHCACHANGGGLAAWAIGDAYSRASISARLTLWGLWEEPAAQFHLVNEQLVEVSARAGFFDEDEGKSIDDSRLLTTAGFPVPPNASILIEASLYVVYDVWKGTVDADFGSGGFNVTCPYMAVALPPE